MMVRTEAWKSVHWEGFRPQLFDLERTRTSSAISVPIPRTMPCARGWERLFDWLASLERRTTVTDDRVEARTDAHRAHGIHIGVW
jgi:hypothetical protein